MNATITKLEAMSLAFAFFKGDKAAQEAEDSVKRYAEANHATVSELKTYFATISVTQHGIKSVTIIKYVKMRPGDTLVSGFAKVDVPEGNYLRFLLASGEYERMENGENKDEVDTYLKAQNLRLNMRNVLFLAENLPSGETVVNFPVMAK